MRELCIPIPDFEENQIAEIQLTVGGKKAQYNFKVESFPWDVVDELTTLKDKTTISLARIQRLKNAIESYDKNWELIEIFTPAENSKYIQVLYRKRSPK
jgi:hypothetical protein